MKKSDKNKLIKIAKCADDFKCAVQSKSFANAHGGVNQIMHKMFDALDSYAGADKPMIRRSGIMVDPK